MGITVSVVIPCYNVELYVAEAVASALGQRYPIAQVVCVDDGSTDGTLSLLQALEAEHPGRLTVRTGPNRGGNHARNVGLSLVESDFVQFLDADDVLDPDKVEHQIRLIEEEPEPIAFIAGAFYKSEQRGAPDEEIGRPGTDTDFLNLTRSSMGSTCSNLWRTSTLRAVGGWDESWRSSQEQELMFRLLKAGGKVLYDPEPKTWVRKRAGSVTANQDPDRLETMIRLRRMMLDHARSEGLGDRVIYELEQSLFGRIRHLGFGSLPRAVEAHRLHLGKGFRPSPNKFDPLYVALYRLFGFERAELLRRALNRLLRRG